jgi:hypothetical protein
MQLSTWPVVAANRMELVQRLHDMPPCREGGFKPSFLRYNVLCAMMEWSIWTR